MEHAAQLHQAAAVPLTGLAPTGINFYEQFGDRTLGFVSAYGRVNFNGSRLHASSKQQGIAAAVYLSLAGRHKPRERHERRSRCKPMPFPADCRKPLQ